MSMLACVFPLLGLLQVVNECKPSGCTYHYDERYPDDPVRRDTGVQVRSEQDPVKDVCAKRTISLHTPGIKTVTLLGPAEGSDERCRVLELFADSSSGANNPPRFVLNNAPLEVPTDIPTPPNPAPVFAEVLRGTVRMRGYVPVIRTPRTTTVAPGSELVTTVSNSSSDPNSTRASFIIALRASHATDPAPFNYPCGKGAIVWLNDSVSSDNTIWACLQLNEYVVVRYFPDPGCWDFERERRDDSEQCPNGEPVNQRGCVKKYKVDSDAEHVPGLRVFRSVALREGTLGAWGNTGRPRRGSGH